LVSYYVASILWGLFHAIPIIICAVQNLLNPSDTLDCIIEKESGFWTALVFGDRIRDAIIPTIVYMIVASSVYVILFRYLALPYFVEDATGMSIYDLIVAAVYIPITEWFSMIYNYFS